MIGQTLSHFEITAKLDHEIAPLPEGASYLGFVFARGESPAEVEAALREAQSTIQPVIVDNLALRNAAYRAG